MRDRCENGVDKTVNVYGSLRAVPDGQIGVSMEQKLLLGCMAGMTG
jgi:hypothetical protein